MSEWKDPERIWLQTHYDDNPNEESVEKAVEYIRADIIDKRIAKLEENTGDLKAEIRSLRSQLDFYRKRIGEQQ